MAVLPTLTDEDTATFRGLIKAYKSRAGLTWENLNIDLGENGDSELIKNFVLGRRDLPPKRIWALARLFSFPARRRKLDPQADDLIDRILAVENPLNLREEIGVNKEEQERFLEEIESRFLTMRVSGADRWTIGAMLIFRPSFKEHNIPRFLSWRPLQKKRTFVKLKGFIFRSGDLVFLNGHVVRVPQEPLKPQIWSAICHQENGDLLGLHLSADASQTIRASRTYCLGVSTDELQRFDPLLGERETSSLGALFESLRAKKKLEQIQTFLTEGSGDFKELLSQRF